MTSYRFSITEEGRAALTAKLAAEHHDQVNRMTAELMGPANTPLPGWACRGPLGWLRDLLRRWLNGDTPDEVAAHRALRRHAGFMESDDAARR